MNAWDEARQTHRRTHLQALAVSDPSDLPPDELEDQARDLAAQALSKRLGRPVDASKLSLHLGQRVAPDEFVAAELKEREMRAAALAELPAEAAAVVAAALLPSLRPTLARAHPELREALADPDDLEIEFTRVSDFLRLIELGSRLSERGLRHPLGSTVLEHLAGFTFSRATLVAASIFPALRAAYAADGEEADRAIFADDALFEEYVAAALDDARWPEAETRLLARTKSHRH